MMRKKLLTIMAAKKRKGELLCRPIKGSRAADRMK